MGLGYHIAQFSCFIYSIQFNKYRVQVYHLQLIKYGVYTYSYKNLGTRTLDKNAISIITLFLGKTILNLHYFHLQCLFQECEDSLQFHTALPSATSSCRSGLCDPRVSVDPGSSLRGQARGRSRFCGASEKRTNTKLGPMVIFL